MKSPVSKTLCFHLHFSSVVCKEDQFVLVLSGLSTKYIFTFLKQYMICIWFLGRHFNVGRPIVCVQAGHHVHTVQHRQAGRSFSSYISFWQNKLRFYYSTNYNLTLQYIITCTRTVADFIPL